MHNSLTETDKHQYANIKKHWLFHWYMCTGSVPGFLWHELNMAGFQAQLPVVVCLVTAGKYPQQLQSNAYVFRYLLWLLANKLSARLFFQQCTPVILWRLNIDSLLTLRVLSETQFEIGDRRTHFSVNLPQKHKLIHWLGEGSPCNRNNSYRSSLFTLNYLLFKVVQYKINDQSYFFWGAGGSFI